MKVLISATQKHINQGEPCDPNNCPLQLAIREVVPKGVKVKVQPGVVTFDLCATNYKYYQSLLPTAAKTFIRTIDLGGEPSPLEFVLNIPEDVVFFKRTYKYKQAHFNEKNRETILSSLKYNPRVSEIVELSDYFSYKVYSKWEHEWDLRPYGAEAFKHGSLLSQWNYYKTLSDFYREQRVEASKAWIKSALSLSRI